MTQCDNKNACHDPVTVCEDNNALRVYCKECHAIIVIRKDYRGVPVNKQYSEVFRREILQGSDPLFYKYYPQWLKN